ncbi:MAG: hypothetical protein CBD98_000935 [Flavobacteriaceae bacterium TMED238]|nr:MAG: hypothetical protein CBD98_000935 [Flavobacteriaceae bacterium TMED238]|tara:strand:+ start:957 stop:2537 length:1581 start_codon:yes stop_codon:yes gene_type:complete
MPYQASIKESKFYIVIPLVFATIYTLGYIDTSNFSHKFFHDDSYYYFKIAQNFIETSEFTFDSINKTNGFHILWLLVLILFGFIFKFFTNSYLDISQIAVLIQIILISLSIRNINSSYSKTFSDKLIVFSVHLMFLPFFLNGMETALIIYLLNIYIQRLFLSKESKKNYLLILLIFLTRYDAVVVVFFISLYNAYKTKEKEPLKQYFLVFVLFVALIVGFNISTGVGLDNLSTSSSVKSYWNELDNEEKLSSCDLENINCNLFLLKQKIEFVPVYMSNVNKLVFSVAEYTSAYNSYGEIPGDVPERRSISLLIIILSIVAFNLIRKNKIEKSDLNVLWFISVAHLTLLSLNSHMFPIHDWYNYFLVSVLVFTLIEILLVQKVALKILFLLLIFVNTYIYVSSPPSEWSKAYSSAANYLNSYENVTTGTWAAGHIGYYSSNPVVNLEGLVASNEIIELNKADKIDVYILENINFIVTNFNPFVENSSRWWLDLRVDPLSRIQNNLKIIKTIKGSDENYTIYIFEVTN